MAKTLFQYTEGNAPATTDYCLTGQDPSGSPAMRRLTWASIRNLFVGAPTAAGDFPVSIDGASYVKRTLAQTQDILGIGSTFPIVIRGGGLIVPATGGCDGGENVTTYVNTNTYLVNKFEKSKIGVAQLDYIPPNWNLGTLPLTMKIMDVGANVLNNCDTAWDAAANVTTSADTSVKVEGTGSNKMACTASLAAGALMATDVITSVDLTYAVYIDMYFRSDVALDAGDLQFLIDNSATCASPTKTWDMPAIAANTWTKVTITCGDMSGAGNNAIISLGFKQVVDKGAMNCYVDCVSYRTNITMTATANCFSAGDDFDIAYPAVIEATGVPGYFTETLLTFASELTVGNTPAALDKLKVQIARKNVATEASGKVCFCGAELLATRTNS